MEFRDGKVAKAKAKKNESAFGNDKSGEAPTSSENFLLTDKDFSRITKFMGETLYDENAGGPNGNFPYRFGRFLSRRF